MQMCAGAVVLTDFVFWLLLYPFVYPSGYRLGVVSIHAANLINILFFDYSKMQTIEVTVLSYIFKKIIKFFFAVLDM